MSQACNTAGLYSTALRLFDQLTPASGPSRSLEYPEGRSEYSEDLDDDGRDVVHASGASSESDSDVTPGSSGSVKPEEPRKHPQQSTHRADGRKRGQEGETISPGSAVGAATSEQSTAGGTADGTRSSESVRNDGDADEGRGMKEGGESEARLDGGDLGMMMVFEDLNDIPDGELIPAAAATIALESCFLGGRRDQAMEIVWQVREP